MKTSVTITLNNVDWRALRQQKVALLDTIARPGITFNDPDLDGIVNFLDRIQDQAAKVLGEEVVFGGDT